LRLLGIDLSTGTYAGEERVKFRVLCIFIQAPSLLDCSMIIASSESTTSSSKPLALGSPDYPEVVPTVVDARHLG
jgi:hypothetical protein